MSSDDESGQQGRQKFVSERVISSKALSESYSSDESNSIGKTKSLITEEIFGPALPPHLMKKSTNSVEGYNDVQMYGPVLPSGHAMQNHDSSTPPTRRVIGPEIPAHLLPVSEKSDSGEDVEVPLEEDCHGPSLNLKASEQDNNFQSFSIKRKTTSSSLGIDEGATQRESWMLELPPEKAANLGLGPRQFRTRINNSKNCDRSEWTDTPADKERKSKQPQVKDDSSTIKQQIIAERDKEMERLARKAEKKLKRKESLLEMHMKKMKKKAKKEAKKREKEKKPVERRPFDRNIDLQANRFDESQKRAIFKKAQLLNDRFSQGESKFL